MELWHKQRPFQSKTVSTPSPGTHPGQPPLASDQVGPKFCICIFQYRTTILKPKIKCMCNLFYYYYFVLVKGKGLILTLAPMHSKVRAGPGQKSYNYMFIFVFMSYKKTWWLFYILFAIYCIVVTKLDLMWSRSGFRRILLYLSKTKFKGKLFANELTVLIGRKVQKG